MNGNQDGNNGPPPALHFLRALGHATLAWGHIAFGSQNDEEGEETPAPRIRRRRRKSFGPAAPRSGSCCAGKR